ncbi:diguanylate cyclase [bacterium]|nr:diguanylate cyclase [bacterium]
MPLELFRNVGIKTRVIDITLLVLLLPIIVFTYIFWSEQIPSFKVVIFLGNIFLFVGLLSAWGVGNSITKPIFRIQRRVKAFAERKAINPVKDLGDDEPAELAKDIDSLFSMWSGEIKKVSKRKSSHEEEETKAIAAHSDLQQNLFLTQSCLNIAQRLNTTFDFHTNLKNILDEAVKVMNVQWASILLLNRNTLEITVVCVRGLEQSLLDDLAEDRYPAIRLKLNEGLAGQVIKGGVPLIANKGHKDPRFKVFSEFKSRAERIASILCSPIKGNDGTVLGVVNFINRISPPFFRNEDIPFSENLCLLASLVIERNKMYRKLFADETTGMTSHKVWKSFFEEEASRAVRYAQALSTIVIDIDHFKEIIDSTSPGFAIRVSLEIGKTIQSSLRDIDLAARVQDRFYLLLPSTDATGAVFLVGRIKEAIEKRTFEHDGKFYSITVSAGISSFPEAGPDGKLLAEYALKALEQAKGEGQNRAFVYGQPKI